jgi:hypothetical protein
MLEAEGGGTSVVPIRKFKVVPFYHAFYNIKNENLILYCYIYECKIHIFDNACYIFQYA